jgi:hypothetical protein
MKVRPVLASLFFACLLMLAVGPAAAHQPVVVDGETTSVSNPEISKAYYGKLAGADHTYTIDSDVEFILYVGILVPDIENANKDVMAEVFSGTELLATIGGVGAAWVTFYEPFGQNTYWDGGDYRIRAKAGVYMIKVSSPSNQSTYSLAVGDIESFDLAAIAKTFVVMPEMEREFFYSSAIELVGTRFGLIYLAVIYSAALAVALLYRLLLRKPLLRFIGGALRSPGRRWRGVVAVALLGLAVTTSWSLALIFVSGLLLFDALFGAFGVAEATSAERLRPS